MRKEYLVFGALLALMLLLFGYESYSAYGHRGMGGMHGGMEQMWDMHSQMMGPSIVGLSWTFWVFLVLLAGFAYLILKSEKDEDPVELLKKRYAKGEITREEYLQAFKDLKE